MTAPSVRSPADSEQDVGLVPDHYVMIGPGWDADGLTSMELYVDTAKGVGMLLAITHARSAIAAYIADVDNSFSLGWTGEVDRSLDWQEQQATIARDLYRKYLRAGYDFVGMWRTGPPTALIAIEVWGRRADGDAIVRIISDAGSEDPQPMDAGTVTAGGTDDACIVWTSEARNEFGEDWLDHHGAAATSLLARRWSAA
jgi:hypothetical protein